MNTCHLECHDETIENRHLRITCDQTGQWKELENKESREIYALEADSCFIETAAGKRTLASARAICRKRSGDSLCFHYDFDDLELTLRYELKADNRFCRRTITFRAPTEQRLLQVGYGSSRWRTAASEVIHYLTFWMAPTVEFIRFTDGGVFTGIENPFYEAQLTPAEFQLSFEPKLILRPGEEWISEPQFIGVYRKSGVMLEDSGRAFRYPNASGYIPIDRNECRAMRAFAAEYLAPEQKQFLNINYQYWHPLPQMPKTEQEVQYYCHAINTFHAIGGNQIIFNPLHAYTKPDRDRAYWNLLPEAPDAAASRIVRHAESLGIGCGFYMGCAAHGLEGNAAGLPFRPDCPDWKKLDAQGHRAPDNCLGCDAFFDWWFEVQNRTIQKYRLKNWSWDPIRGSACNCHDESHGHLALGGAYKGWRRCMELAKKLKEANPGLFIQAFYGTKQYGLWGLKYVDGHEVYNEQTADVCTHHTQISDDRQNADGLRFQNNWSMRFRFLPAVIGHPLVGRMNLNFFDPELVKACDYYGWRYALLSALAVSGSIMPAILPYTPDLLPGYVEFYRKWTQWARQNFDLVPYTEPFGGQVDAGTIDGYARIRDDHGFLFLFNGNPRSAEIVFEIGDEIHLEADGIFELLELFPSEEPVLIADCTGKSCWHRGESATLRLAANSCLVCELRRKVPDANPQILNSNATLAVESGSSGDRIMLSGVRGRPGRRQTFYLRVPGKRPVSEIWVNGTANVPFHRTPEGLRFSLTFSGEKHERELDYWVSRSGGQFPIPNPESREAGETIRCGFQLAADIPELLRKATPPNAAEMDQRIASWQQSSERSYEFHNFVCCRPHRLWLILPFTSKPEPLARVELNGNNLTPALRRDRYGNAFYLDLTDQVRWGERNELELELPRLAPNDFMGPYLLYPEEAPTDQLDTTPAAVPAESETPEVVYRHSLVPLPAHRYDPAAAPKILDAQVSGRIRSGSSVVISARTEPAAPEVERVFLTESGFPWMGIHQMTFDAESGRWQLCLQGGARRAIQEHEFVYLWAEDRHGRHSDYLPLRIEWEFAPSGEA